MNQQPNNERKELKKKTISGLFYRFSERILAQTVSTIVSIVLARLLMPDDYATIALVTVMIALCNVFVSDGLGSALIQNKDSDDTDFSTCFWSGFCISVVLYAVLFFTAPIIAAFYSNPLLTPVIRVMCLSVIVASLKSVQHSYVSKHLQFKKFFFSTLGGTILSAAVGLIMAYKGYGVWALVAQYLTNNITDTVIMFFSIKWKPRLIFSLSRAKKIFSYSWKLFVSGFLNQLYNELRTLVIAKKYTKSDLAFYNKGYSFPSLIVTNINSSINSVIFPVLAKSNTKEEMKQSVRRGLGLSSYILFPLLLGFAAVAEPFVTLVLTEKWLGCVIFIQIFCVSDMIAPMNSIAANVMRATGRSDLVLKNGLISKFFNLIVLIVSCFFGTVGIAVGTILTSIIAMTINSIPLNKLISYKPLEEISDILPSILLSVIMAAAVWALSLLNINTFLLLMLQIFAGIFIYILLSVIFKVNQFVYLKNMLLKKLHKKH